MNGLDRLSLGVDAFAEFYDEHMRKEEEQFNPELAGDYRRLYQCIVEQIPPPLGSHLRSATPRATGKSIR